MEMWIPEDRLGTERDPDSTDKQHFPWLPQYYKNDRADKKAFISGVESSSNTPTQPSES
jgi:hypothetical protein